MRFFTILLGPSTAALEKVLIEPDQKLLALFTRLTRK
jgi:hypothetical protein